jgi:Mn2+/Fe2+ NRAMP family transporter
MSRGPGDHGTTVDGDPYVLDASKVEDPPKGWRGSLRLLGPGMITSAAIVGSGELITATILGAQVGFMLLWLVLVSTFVKVAVQIELARWTISTGKPAIFGYDLVPPRIAGRGWISYLSVLMVLQFVTSQAGVISTSGLALSLLVPVFGPPASMASIGFWVAVLVVAAVAIHIANRYAIIERVSTALVGIVTFAAIALVFGIQATPFAWSAGDVGSGLTFQLALGAVGVAISMFGLTGVGAGEVTSYSFWCVEKGYAAWTGPNDGSEEWRRRARGWIAVMKKDAWVSWGVYTVSTAAFYILGAAVLHPQGLVPEGNEVLTTISRIFSDTLGSWAGVAFLAFAAVTLYKTILANVPSLSRITVAALSVFGAFDWGDARARARWLRAMMIAMPLLWGLLGVVVNAPLALVIIGGTLNAFYLITVAIATVYLSTTQTDPGIRDGRLASAYLIVSAVAIVMVGVLGLVALF